MHLYSSFDDIGGDSTELAFGGLVSDIEVRTVDAVTDVGSLILGNRVCEYEPIIRMVV